MILFDLFIIYDNNNISLRDKKKIIPDIQARDIIHIYFYIFTQVSMTLCVHKLWPAWCSMCKHCEHPWQAKLVVVVFALFLLNHSLIFIYYRAISICDKKNNCIMSAFSVCIFHVHSSYYSKCCSMANISLIFFDTNLFSLLQYYLSYVFYDVGIKI